jgi:hypothetical protein
LLQRIKLVLEKLDLPAIDGTEHAALVQIFTANAFTTPAKTTSRAHLSQSGVRAIGKQKPDTCKSCADGANF